jgi:hypothetical protein
MEHTQGKWEVKHWDGEQWPDRRWSVSVNEGGISKAICISPRYFTHDPESLANAQLITAAPETAAERDSLKEEVVRLKGMVDGLLADLNQTREINAKLLEALENAIQTNEALRSGKSIVNMDEAIAYWESIISKNKSL